MIVKVGVPCKFTNDAKRLLLEHFDAIHSSPSQIYHVALPFTPSSSWLYKCYSAELSLGVRVVKGLSAEWGACSRTVSQNSPIRTLSYWNNTIAIGSGRMIIIFDATTGSQTAALSGHVGSVRSVVYSLDGRSIVSGSDDTTVKLWDVQTGGVVKSFHGHTFWVETVSISADNTRIASGSHDNTICLWNVSTGEHICTIEKQKIVSYVYFSPINPQHIISISDKKVQQWDINGHQLSPVYDGVHINFSPDYTQFALCHGKIVTVQNSDSREIVAELHVANDDTNYCCFSPDGRFIAAAAHNTIYVWDIKSPDHHLVEIFASHSHYITSLAFSSPSSLISASADHSIKFWKIGGLPMDLDITSQQPTPAPICSVSLQAKAGVSISHDSDGVVKIWDILTGICKESFHIPGAEDLSPGDSDAKLIDGRLIIVWYKSKKIYIWDTGTGGLLQTLDTPPCLGLRISGDESKLFFLNEEYIRGRPMWTWEPMGEVKLGLGRDPYLDSLCIESSRVRVHFRGLSPQEGWDFGISGSSPTPFDPSTGRPHLDFIGGASWQTKDPCWIKDTVTGKEVFRLSGRYAIPTDVQWDGQYLVAGYESGEVLILDFHDMYSR